MQDDECSAGARQDPIRQDLNLARALGYRIMNRVPSERDTYMYCVVCNEPQITEKELEAHLQEDHPDMYHGRAILYSKYMFTKGFRGPVFIESVVDEICNVNGNADFSEVEKKSQVSSILSNLLRNVGVGTNRNPLKCIKIADMDTVFQKDYVKTEDEDELNNMNDTSEDEDELNDMNDTSEDEDPALT